MQRPKWRTFWARLCPRFHDRPLRQQLRALQLVFVAMILSICLVGLASMTVLNGIRIYMGGEAQWVISVNNAMAYLDRYALTHHSQDFRQYQHLLAIPLGERAARLQLEQGHPNFQRVRADFVAGHNNPQDIPLAISFFRVFHRFGPMRQVIHIWSETDPWVLNLQHVGQQMHQATVDHTLTAARARALQTIMMSDVRHLLPLQIAFAHTLGHAARVSTRLLYAVLAVATALFLGIGTWFVTALSRRLGTALQILHKGSLAVADGRLDEYLPVVSQSELGQLAQIFNAMTENLRRAQAHRETQAQELASLLEESRNIMETNPDCIYVSDLQFRLTKWNRRLEEATGYTSQELFRKPLPELMDPADRDYAQQCLAKNWTFEAQLRAKDGRLVPYHWTVALLSNGQGDPTGLVGAARDMSERKALEEQLRHQAFHDVLTGLPNRTLFAQRVEHAVVRLARHPNALAVCFLDLDRFKTINDNLGHETGDQLLIAVAQRLTQCLRPEDTLARMGGDEFTILLEDTQGPEEVVPVVRRILKAMQAPFRIASHDIRISCSIGVTFGQSAHQTLEDLLRQADLAMYQAKHLGRAQYALYEPELVNQSQSQFRLEHELRSAIDTGQLSVLYQPVVHLEDGSLREVEALVRWNHPERGLLAPSDFIPLAEETGLIIPIGLWVLRQACRQTRQWQSEYASHRRLGVTVNLSARQFRHPYLIADLQEVLEETQLPPQCLTLEITESVILLDDPRSRDTLAALKETGVRLAIDDFGTGFSALPYLKFIPADVLKIDRSFVHGLGQNPQDHAIVKAIVDFARALGLEVTAEGVESHAQRQQLQRLTCELGQGFLFSQPLDSQGIRDLLMSPGWRPPQA